MKVTIELSEEQVAGIRSYLQEVDGNESPTKQDVKDFINGEIYVLLNEPGSAVADYVSQQTR
jgi:hypothetical protein